MIANITKGRKAVGALIYDFGPGRRDEHINPRIVAGNVTGTPLQVARAIDHTARRRPGIAAPIWRTSLSLPDEDGILPDAQWADIATAFIADMGFDGAPWVAVRHGDDHIHLTVSRVDWAGQLLTDRWDYRRAREAADRLEEEHDLVRARDRFRAEGPQVRNNELEASKRRRGPEPDRPPEREELRRLVREVRDASRGLGRAAFESGLADAGVHFRANEASTGRMNGYSFTLDGLVDGAGEQIWHTASKVAKDLRWAQLKDVIGDDPTAGLDAAATAERVDRATEMLRRGRIERGAGQPGDHPALSTDPAARILAQWQAKAAGQEVPAEALPTQEPVPAWTDKRRRPHGALATDSIPAEIKAARRQISTWQAEMETARSNARTWDGMATGAVTGPRVRELHQLAAKVEAARPHIEAEVTAHKDRQAADTAADAARKIWREANRLKGLGWLDLRREGTSRKAEEKRAATASEAIHAYVEQASKATSRAAAASRAAQKASGLPWAEGEDRRLRAEWPQLLADAQRGDQDEGQARRDTELARVEDLARRIEGAETRIARLGQEGELRRTMPAGQRQAEARARSAAARSTPSTARRRKAGPARPQGEQPAHLRRRPPSPGGPGKTR
ncbi:relaxase/mobilization nuclease domain-containing protein [Streptomyces sp. CS7]|uniref:relaxase/mobilization nuclease domain-containing protein n=1 Tax=Streptomyces sp. CS-7 TaxID=2906769 RepID=UPI0021B1D1A3|nr:relaxase/mobilization nuclease domain-containing protein [Streptomyces sp. CS-7]MCT6782308.1 relaxase/mobilization nuclease domain-containing protein [Streptomyces sp. CS-7]